MGSGCDRCHHSGQLGADPRDGHHQPGAFPLLVLPWEDWLPSFDGRWDDQDGLLHQSQHSGYAKLLQLTRSVHWGITATTIFSSYHGVVRWQQSIHQIHPTRGCIILSHDEGLFHHDVGVYLDTANCCLHWFVSPVVASHRDHQVVVPLYDINTAITYKVKETTTFFSSLLSISSSFAPFVRFSQTVPVAFICCSPRLCINT